MRKETWNKSGGELGEEGGVRTVGEVKKEEPDEGVIERDRSGEEGRTGSTRDNKGSKKEKRGRGTREIERSERTR